MKQQTKSNALSIVIDLKQTNTTETDNFNKSKVIAKRYSLFLKEKQNTKSCCCSVQCAFQFLEKGWNCLLPIWMRGVVSENQKALMHKRKFVKYISKHTIQQNLQRRNKTVVIGYEKQKIDELFEFVRDNETLKRVREEGIEICPMQISKDAQNRIWYQKLSEYCQERNKVLQFPAIITVWKGLFEQLLVLNLMLPTQNPQVEEIINSFIIQLQYEEKIENYLRNGMAYETQVNSDYEIGAHSHKIFKFQQKQ